MYTLAYLFSTYQDFCFENGILRKGAVCGILAFGVCGVDAELLES
jgi:hypothetical protein